MPTPILPFTPKEVRILRKFNTPRVGLDWENQILKILLHHGFITQVTNLSGVTSGEITPAGTAYLASLPS